MSKTRFPVAPCSIAKSDETLVEMPIPKVHNEIHLQYASVAADSPVCPWRCDNQINSSAALITLSSIAAMTWLSRKTGPCPLHVARPFNRLHTSPISTISFLLSSWLWIRSHVAPADKRCSPSSLVPKSRYVTGYLGSTPTALWKSVGEYVCGPGTGDGGRKGCEPPFGPLLFVARRISFWVASF